MRIKLLYRFVYVFIIIFECSLELFFIKKRNLDKCSIYYLFYIKIEYNKNKIKF